MLQANVKSYVMEEPTQQATGENWHFPSGGNMQWSFQHFHEMSEIQHLSESRQATGRQTQHDINNMRIAAKRIPLMNWLCEEYNLKAS